MDKVCSSGGVVFLGNSVLMLKKLNGDWVLPKGTMEKEESSEETALREVKEETMIKAKIITPLGETCYRFKNYWSNNAIIEKKVYWFLMEAITSKPRPQREEGFVDAKFMPWHTATERARYDDERDMIKQAIRWLESTKK